MQIKRWKRGENGSFESGEEKRGKHQSEMKAEESGTHSTNEANPKSTCQPTKQDQNDVEQPKPTMKWCYLLSSVAHTGNTIIELASTTSPIIKRHNLPLLHHHLNTLHSLQNLFFVSYNEVQHRSARWHTIVSDLSHSHQNLVNSLHTHQTSTTSSHMHQTSDNSVVHPPNLDNSRSPMN